MVIRQKSTIILFYHVFCLILVTPLPGIAQSTSPQQPEPEPLPSEQAPFKLDPSAPPTVEESVDIPGQIVVDRFNFVGSTVFSEEELNEATAEFLGKPITFSQLLQAANQVTELYLEKGYITSGAYIPSQAIQSGEITIQVVEGRLEEIDVTILEGQLKSDYVRDRIAIASSQPLNINRLQEALQLLQFNPLIENLSAELSAGTQPGTNSLSVQVVGAKTFSASLDLNNNRNSSIGSFERGIKLSDANLLGLGDKLDLNYANTDGSNQFEGSYTLPVNPRNGSLRFGYQVSNNQIIEDPFDDLDLEVDYRQYELNFRQPVLARATPEYSQELALSLGIVRKESDSSLLGIDFPLSPGADEQGEVRISKLNFAQEWLQRSPQQVIRARSEFGLGIDAFNATVNNEEPDGEFFLWRGQLLYLRLLSERSDNDVVNPTLLVRSELQLSSASLLNLEQFSLGGSPTVRGYRQDRILSDNAFFLSAEARLPILRVPEVQGTLQIAPFIDFGTGWNVDSDQLDPSTLAGVGVGLLWQMQETLNARLDWGIPLLDGDDPNSDSNTLQQNGLYFQIEYTPF
ncbi:MAG: BamA/TamA family outer membrane protein [Cyanobacteria bacterium]|jgi:hemolysin activation/secretion protein|nr:BamA/TamA family outer membrane protein [Cyanobacteria bacterium GSL.Bin1]